LKQEERKKEREEKGLERERESRKREKEETDRERETAGRWEFKTALGPPTVGIFGQASLDYCILHSVHRFGHCCRYKSLHTPYTGCICTYIYMYTLSKKFY
jgi:hypothetical protein